jgi:peptidoglycan/LPS O-acetylase OafA/YrhL
MTNRKVLLLDIQGLRAFAVLAVVAYHAFPTVVRSGFIGVDVFFAISGYIITKVILESIANGSFTFGRYYASRTRRIVPPLLVTIVATIIAGYALLSSDELKELAKHGIAGASFLSNFLLWKEVNYFDASSEAKPFLHLWSLGVEWQFYLLWPLIVLALTRIRYFWVVAVLLTIGSFCLCVTTSAMDHAAAFYSPISRFWEFSVSGLLAYWTARRADSTKRLPWQLPEGAAVLGWSLLLCAVALIDRSMFYPGVWSLLPIFGTSLIIFAGQTSVVNRSLLNHPVIQWIGKISYTLYLTHWPILSFLYILQNGRPGIKARIIGVGAAFILAWLLHVRVEKKMQRKNGGALPVKGPFVGYLASVGLCAVMFMMNGFPQHAILNASEMFATNANARSNQGANAPEAISVNFTPESLANFKKNRANDPKFVNNLFFEKDRLQRYGQCHLYDPPGNYTSFEEFVSPAKACVALSFTRKNILVFGDSMAAEMWAALSKAYPEVNFVQITGSACKPFHAAYSAPDRCVQLLDYALDFAKNANLDGVVVASIWENDFSYAIPELKKFKEYGHGKLVLVGPPLKFSEDVLRAISRLADQNSTANVFNNMIETSYLKITDQMRRFSADHDFVFVDRIHVYCAQGCKIMTDGGVPLILDRAHLSVPGLDILSGALKEGRFMDSILH